MLSLLLLSGALWRCTKAITTQPDTEWRAVFEFQVKSLTAEELQPAESSKAKVLQAEYRSDVLNLFSDTVDADIILCASPKMDYSLYE